MKRSMRIVCQMEQNKIFDIIRESLGAIRNMAADCLIVPLLDEIFQLSPNTEEDNGQPSFSLSNNCKKKTDSVRCGGYFEETVPF